MSVFNKRADQLTAGDHVMVYRYQWAEVLKVQVEGPLAVRVRVLYRKRQVEWLLTAGTRVSVKQPRC